MPAKGTPAYYAARRQQPAAKPTTPPGTVRCPVVVNCPNASCAAPYLSYHPKCPFCGTAA